MQTIRNCLAARPIVRPEIRPTSTIQQTLSRKGKRLPVGRSISHPEGGALVIQEQSCHSMPVRVCGDGKTRKPFKSGFDRRADLIRGLESKGLKSVAAQLQGCCARPIAGTEFLTVKESGAGLRHVSGLMHCGRHLCPICHPFHAGERRADLETLIGVNWEAGKHFLFTPTARHRRGVKWSELAGAIKSVSRKMQQTRRWKENVLGFTRSDESTWSTKSGHHFHQHYLLTLKNGADSEAFSLWLKDYWEKAMLKAGRTCDWDGMNREWWKPIQSEGQLHQVLNYQTKEWEEERAEGVETPEALRGAVQEITGAGTKGQTPWDWPPEVFAEIWEASKGHRWFGAAGIWKQKNAPEVTEDEIEARREQKGKPIAWVHAEDWNSLAKETRVDLLSGAYSRNMDHSGFVAWWSERSIELGGILGLGEPPEEPSDE